MANTSMTKEQYNEIMGELRDLKTRVSHLPDKASIYTASLAIHGVVWASILGTIIALNALEII